ncbi:hypothetical protein POF50_028170 [Streptomyces sp. SL13]|jgi:hypothetical protein|uniref:Uncharacterized protein n=1 Tax=Streptantibioticus silvisoli TaxID=2705255 RepID=A0AA90HCG2_9ACTN|nr:hypothetical protein [Streptantibioticus silvisoli]MDI5963135.1 hypothetical protein [Streptantibioticus silvisoli]MDI5973175.1 hypothetical protein [Streptantibioticus silvisoli]
MPETSQETPAAETGQDARTERRVARLARQISAFATGHGGSADGQIAYLGEIGSRIVLVGADGAWGDLVAPSHEIARRAVERAGITVHDDFDGELAATVRTGPYEWKRMAGIQLGGAANR